jgi:hypothetical protein
MTDCAYICPMCHLTWYFRRDDDPNAAIPTCPKCSVPLERDS